MIIDMAYTKWETENSGPVIMVPKDKNQKGNMIFLGKLIWNKYAFMKCERKGAGDFPDDKMQIQMQIQNT